jgi:flavin-dependent thymidylate synthase
VTEPARKFLGAFDGADSDPPPGTDITKYVDKAMFGAEAMPKDAQERPRVYLLSATPDPLGAVAAFSMIYEGKAIRDLRDVTDEQRRFYWEECFKTTLQAPLEAIDLHFMVEGLTRASWDQMVRQRTAVFGGESLRFAVKEDLQGAVRPGPMVHEDARKVWDDAIESIQAAYLQLISTGVPAEDARGLLPMNVLTRGHWKTNLRNLYAELGKRTCTQAQWEWRLIAADLREAVKRHIAFVPDPWSVRTERMNMTTGEQYSDDAMGRSTGWQFRLIAETEQLWRPVCFNTGRCMFKANADRGCTIRERVEAGNFEAISAEEWMLDPTAGWVR